MIKNFIELIKKESLIEKGDKILIGLSGGPDSVALVTLFFEIKNLYNLSLGFCHINHLLREDDSEEDELFCKNLANRYNTEIFVLREDIAEYSKKNKIGLEEAGRNIRYDFFENISKNNGYNKIALAHNLDDNVETFLFRLFRGTGIHGLKSIPVKRNNIIRPLLSTQKTEILDYLKEKNEAYRIDLSNNETIYSRNKIRLELVPYIEKEFNPKFKESIHKLINDFDTYEEDIYEELDLVTLKKLSDNEKKKKIFSYLRGFEIEISRAKVDEVLNILDKEGYKEIHLGKGLVLKKNYNNIKVEVEESKNYKKDKIQLDIPNKIGYNGYTIETKLVENVMKAKDHFYFDYDKITKPIFVRTKIDGDSFIPVGMENQKKLKKFFIDEKVEKEKRESIPIVFSGEEVLLVGNLRSSKLANLTENSNKILLLKVEEGIFSE